MGDGINIEGAQTELGSLIHEATIFSAQREVLAQQEVPTRAVDKRASSLVVDPRN